MMRHLSALLAACCLSLLLLPATVSGADSGLRLLDPPVKAETDQRAYRNLVLANGMKVLLVSDPTADKAAAALDVAAGSGHDPRHRQGLAHFLEHMLFLGTAKYPDPGEYHAFISQHGGSHNAFTSLEHTNYFFDIDPLHLEPALDRFAQFFVAPLFNGDYVNREKHAVHSEYQARITDDGRRLADVYRELYHSSNPAATFTVGSLDTLADAPGNTVRDDLLAFYERHYSANTMALVVLGREDLDTLQAMVASRFSAVVNRDRQLDRSPRPVFRDGLLPARVQVQSRRDERNLVLAFPLPAMQPHYRTKPDVYLAYLLGHEGEGSLLAVLKQRGWAEGLAAGTGMSHRHGATFDVSIQLTAEGYRHIDEIVALFFQTVELLQQQGLDAWRYDEQKVLADLAFRFQEPQVAIHYVSELAINLHYYPPADVLRGNYLMEHLDAALVRDVLSRLTSQNLLLVVMAPDNTAPGQSQFYATPYAVSPVGEQQLAQWRSFQVFSGVSLPPPNPFIPDKLKLKSRPLLSLVRGMPTVPQKLTGSRNSTVWHLQDTRFGVPKGSVMVYARSRHASATVREAAMSELFVRLLNDHLNPLLYTASLGGLDFDISKRSRGIAFQLTGYSDKQGLLLKSVMDTFRNPVFDDARFRLVKQQWQDELRNAAQDSPYKTLLQDVPVLLAHGYWARNDFLDVLERITLKDVQDYVLEFSNAIVADVLVYGNFYPAEAEKLAKVVENSLKLDSPRQPDIPVRVVALPPVERPFLYVDQVSHDDVALAVYFQGAGDDVAEQVRQAMLAQVLQSPFFHALRTEQQLGYIVTSRYLPLARVPGVLMLVQSPTVDAGTIAERTRRFLADHYAFISRQDDAWFEQQKQALLVQLQQRPQNIAEQAIEYWNDMTLDYTGFDSREQQVAALQVMTRDQLLETYRNTLLQPATRQLWLASPGKAGLGNLAGVAVETLPTADALKQRTESYALQ